MRVTTFASGSSGNCALVSMSGVHILIDAGISFRRIKENLALSGLTPAELTAVLITHEHTDHIGGLTTMLKHCAVPIYAPRTVADHLRYAVAGVEQCLHILPVGEVTDIGGVAVMPFHTPHDTKESVGYRLTGEGVFAVATDMGCVTEEVRDGLSGADAVLIESNHDVEMLKAGPYPFPLKKRILSDHGHLSNENCAVLAAELVDSGTGYILLGHLSRENNTPEAAFRTVSAALGGRKTHLFVVPAAERFTLEIEKEPLCSR